MATQEKLQKSLEALKTLSESNQASDKARKKEKIHHCHVVTEAISNNTIRISANFQVLLGITIETFLRLCDDPESDIRMTSEECLNRVIRAVSDDNMGKIQIELHKEIKKNGSAKSLRAALWRFSQLTHHIRPHKGKAYVSNLFPVIVKISQRSEEAIHETLASSLPKIVKVLGNFAPDNEVKVLLKAFLSNISHQSPVIRRTSATCILNISLNSRKPYLFLAYSINYLIDLLVPVNENQPNELVLGVMSALKLLIPNLRNYHSDDGKGSQIVSTKDADFQPLDTNKLLQIYELCLYFVTNKDHNVINASLETLNVLILNATDELRKILLNQNGIDKYRIHKTQSMSNVRSPSQLSVATNATSTEDNLFSDIDLTETVQRDIEKWIGESHLSVMNVNFAKSSEKSHSTDTLTSRTGSTTGLGDFGNFDKLPENFGAIELKSLSVGDNLDKVTSSNSSEKSYSYSTDDKLLSCDNDYQEIDVGDYLDKNISLLYCMRFITKSFLLVGTPGKYTNDKTVRVSVKSLALSCVSSILKIYPEGFLKYLDRSYVKSAKEPYTCGNNQLIAEVLLFSDHTDPQLRGVTRCLVSNFIGAVMSLSRGNYGKWIVENGGQLGEEKVFRIENLVNIFIQGLKDESSTCLRQTLLSLNPTLNVIAESQNSSTIVPVLEILPLLASNPYWLVKVGLCELVSKISYVTIRHITGNDHFQSEVLYNILFELLKDDDQRIRTASASAFIEIVPNLFYEEFQSKQTIVTTKAIYLRDAYLSNLCDRESRSDNIIKKHFINNMPFPYTEIARQGCDRIDFTLSKIVTKLYSYVLSSTSKYFISGCIETLSLLSNKFPCTVYKKSWCNLSGSISEETIGPERKGYIPDLLSLCVSLLTCSVHVYDLQFQMNLINLASNLYAGYSLSVLRPVPDLENAANPWDMFVTASFSDISDQYLGHVVKLLNVFHYVLNDNVPVHPHSKAVLPHLPSASSMSPIKRRKSDMDRKVLSPGKIIEKEEKHEKRDTARIGSIVYSQHYVKIFGMLRNSYINYKISLDIEVSEKFLDFLHKTLHSLSVIMEVATLNEFGKIAEEILEYLRSTFRLDPTGTVRCVQQLLKCLFGTNLTANVMEFVDECNGQCGNEEPQEDASSFYHNISQIPYNQISGCINSLNNINKLECDGDSTVMGYLHRKDVKVPTILSRNSDKTLANYIRIFEPMVIKSLKQYTVTSNVKLQCSVLQLLNQLIQLRVNYCLLDSEQVFIGFVLKQFEYIEEGQLAFAQKLIPKIFQFLVQLSYSKQHSKCIMSVPKIIQLCDGLMASGQCPLTHCIPSLEPIVEDIFLTRNKANTTDMKELETTREVMLCMLLRLLEYKEVINLLTLILEDSKYCTDNTEKWLRWSQQIVNIALPLLKQNKIKLDDTDAFLSMRKFIFALNPNVFSPMDHVIVMLFQQPPDTEDNVIFNRWVCKILLLLLLVTLLKEDVLLSKINQLKPEFSPATIFENYTVTADPLNVYNNADAFENISAEQIFIIFLFRIMNLISKVSLNKRQNRSDRKDGGFLVSQFYLFLMFCLYIFQSGSHCKIANEAIQLVKNTVKDVIKTDSLNRNFLELARIYPLLTFQWCNILTVLNYSNLSFWNKVILGDISEDAGDLRSSSLNEEISKAGGTIVYCDYLNENISQTEELYWILSKNTAKLVDFVDETPVSEFISFVHRNATISKVFVEFVGANCFNFDDPVFKARILKCIENSHASQNGAVLNLLLPKMLNYRLVALSRVAANLASRKIEYLLTLPMEDVTSQVSSEDLIRIREDLVSLNLVKKHEALVSLLNKLLTQYYDLSPIEFDQRRMVNPEYIKKLNINKKWYLEQIQGKYKEPRLGKELAEMMDQLEYNEVVSFMSSSDFNRSHMQDCIRLGVRNIQKYTLKEEPPILKAAIDSLLKDISSVASKICGPHQVFDVSTRDMTSPEAEYSNYMVNLFKSVDFPHLLVSLAPSVSSYLSFLPHFPTLQLSDVNQEDVIKFAVVSLEYVNYIIHIDENSNFNVDFVNVLLNAANDVFKQQSLVNILETDSNITWLCSTVDSVFKLVRFLLKTEEPLPSIPNYLIDQCLSSDDKETLLPAAQSCNNLYVLVSWLYKIKNKYVNIPEFLLGPVKSIVIALSRLRLYNSYVLIPSKVWKSGWQPELTGTFNTQVPPLPIDLLQEIDVLEEYIFRITLLGWTFRQQFEETWMCFLSVLCSPLDHGVDSAELSDAIHASSLAIKAITALLMQTLCFPVLGCSNVSKIVHVSRNLPVADDSLSIKKLRTVHSKLQQKYEETSFVTRNSKIENVFDQTNFEKVSDCYSFGQMSVRYFLIATNMIDDENDNSLAAKVYKKRVQMLEESGLDVNSCLQFLLDYYTQLMKPESSTNIKILYEAVRSTVIISDLFTDRSQFSWMKDVFLELSKIHPVEDELLHQYLIVGICKAVAVLNSDLEIFEQVKRMLVQYFKSPFISSRIACLHGILYILEGCKLTNITIGGISDEMQLILPCAVEYVQLHINTTNSVLRQSQEHTMLVWSLAFYLIENVEEIHMESNFVINTLQTAFSILQTGSSNCISNSIIKGVERILIVKKQHILEKVGKQVLKLALQKMKDDNPAISILGIQLLLSYMYNDCSEHLESPKKSKDIQTSPDHLVQTVEKITAIFERIKKGYVLEVEVLCSVLPSILRDFFSPSDILTKVIGEFLSPQQPHPKLLSKVVFKVFEWAIEENQLSLLQDWVVFSLSNFTQSFSIGMATWCLTCFFISASSNPWLRCYFPYVQTRVGRYEYEDKKMLCIVGSDFYRNLTNDKQKNTFIENFTKVKDEPGTPFNDLLSSL